MNNKHYLFAVAFVLVCAQSYGKATPVNNQWQKVDDDWSGSITNVARWSQGHLPQIGERLYTWNRATDYTLSFSETDFTSPANLRVAAGDDHTVTLDGTNAKWVISGSDDGTETSDGDPFRVYANGSVPIFNFTIPDAVALYSHAIAELEDFKFAVTGSSAGNPKIEFFGGTYDFRDPDDSPWETEKKPLLLICNGDGAATGCPEAIFRNVTMRAWDVGIQAGGQQGGKVLFDGGNCYFGDMAFPNGSTGYANNYASRSDTTLTNGAVVSAEAVTFGHRANKDVRLHLSGAGTVFEARGAFSAPNGAGQAFIDISDGAEMRFQGKAAFVNNGGTNVTRIVGGRIVSSGAAELIIGNLNAASRIPTSLSVIAATNATVSTPGQLVLNHIADVTIAGDDSVWSCGSFTTGSAALAGTNPKLVLEGGRFTVTNDSTLANFDTGDIVIKGGTFTVARYFNIGGNSGSLGRLTVEGGVYDNDFSATECFAPNPVGTVTYLAKSATTAKGVLNVTGGEAKFYSLYAGWIGASEINVSGGKLSCRSDLRLGNSTYSDAGEHVLTQTGGEIYLPFAVKDNVGGNAAAHVRIRLNGGTFSCKALQAGKASAAREGKGQVVLEADGGKIAALDDSATVKYPLLSYFDEATVKDGGLTIDTQGHAITLNQDMSGTGTLTLTGGGTVTFTAGNMVAVPVKVVGNTKVVFNGVVPKGLTLGDAEGAAVLELASGTAVAVDGDLVIGGALDLAVDGLVVGNTYNVFTVTGDIDDGTAAKWIGLDVKGVPTAAAYDAVVTESEGLKRCQLVIREPKEIPIEVADGVSETRFTNITWKVNDRLTTTVGEGGELCLEGELRKGFLIKDGLGTLTLSNPDSSLFNGVLFRLGTLNFDYPEDGALADWMITLDASAASDALNLTSDRSVAIRDVGVAGTGVLRVSTASEIALDVTDGVQRRQTGRVYVEEGTFALRGTGSSPANYSIALASGEKGSSVIIGQGGVGGGRANRAGLLADNVLFSGSFSLASNINDSAVVDEAYLIVTNKGKVSGTITLLECVGNNPKKSAKVWALLDNGTLSGSCEVKYHHLQTPPLITARNGSYLLGGWNFRGDADFLLDASTMAGDDKGTPIILGYYANWDYTNNFTFVNGSVLNAQALKCPYKTAPYTYPAHFHLHFDDSEWKGMPDGFFGYVDPKSVDPADNSRNPYVEVRVKNAGLKLNVPADATYSWAYPLMDESADVAGGFVKQGEGTLKVLKKTNPDGTFTDDFSFAHTGPTVVEDGVLDLNGNMWTHGTIGGGAGVVANGTLKSAKIALEVEDGAAKALPNFAADCVFDGRVKVDLGGANLPVGATFEVANYAGTAPNVAKWKLIGNGETAGTFTAAGGKVMAEVTPKGGLLLIVR